MGRKFKKGLNGKKKKKKKKTKFKQTFNRTTKHERIEGKIKKH